MTIKETAVKMLDDLRAQLAHFEEQSAMARGAIQALEHLLANSDAAEVDDGIQDDTTAQIVS